MFKRSKNIGLFSPAGGSRHPPLVSYASYRGTPPPNSPFEKSKENGMKCADLVQFLKVLLKVWSIKAF